jgi:hypothetical protein
MKKILIIATLILVGCTHDPKDAHRLLRQEGITSVNLHGHPFISGCAKGEDFATTFTGIKNGVPVNGVICGGWMKSNTIRYN